MALTPQDLINPPLSAKEEAEVVAFELEIDDYLTEKYRGEELISYTSTEAEAPSHRVQQEIIRRYTVPDDPNRGWSEVEFEHHQYEGWWITFRR